MCERRKLAIFFVFIAGGFYVSTNFSFAGALFALRRTSVVWSVRVDLQPFFSFPPDIHFLSSQVVDKARQEQESVLRDLRTKAERDRAAHANEIESLEVRSVEFGILRHFQQN